MIDNIFFLHESISNDSEILQEKLDIKSVFNKFVSWLKSFLNKFKEDLDKIIFDFHMNYNKSMDIFNKNLETIKNHPAIEYKNYFKFEPDIDNRLATLILSILSSKKELDFTIEQTGFDQDEFISYLAKSSSFDKPSSKITKKELIDLYIKVSFIKNKDSKILPIDIYNNMKEYKEKSNNVYKFNKEFIKRLLAIFFIAPSNEDEEYTEKLMFASKLCVSLYVDINRSLIEIFLIKYKKDREMLKNIISKKYSNTKESSLINTELSNISLI